MIVRHRIAAKAVYINNLNTGRTARTWEEVRVAVLSFAQDLFPGKSGKPLATLLGAFGINPVRFDLTAANSVETPKSFTVTLERPRLQDPHAANHSSSSGAAVAKNPKKEGAPF